jgi:hypothetical protein
MMNSANLKLGSNTDNICNATATPQRNRIVRKWELDSGVDAKGRKRKKQK